MPFVDGVSLLAQRLGAQPRLLLDEVRKIVREVGSALSYAHSRGIVHSGHQTGDIPAGRLFAP